MLLKNQPYRAGILALSIILFEGIAVVALILYGMRDPTYAKRLEMERSATQTLLLTDLCVCTESRHTRHISLPEPLAPFQDLPGFHDHFPSSTFLSPPRYLFRRNP
jgi:hypothetical protein